MPKFLNKDKSLHLNVEKVKDGVSFMIEHTNQSDFLKQISIPDADIPAIVRYLQESAPAGTWIPVYDNHPPD